MGSVFPITDQSNLGMVPAAHGGKFHYATGPLHPKLLPRDPAGNQKNTAARLVATLSIEARAKREVEMLQPPWIEHNFPEHLQIIANHLIQSLISVSWLP